MVPPLPQNCVPGSPNKLFWNQSRGPKKYRNHTHLPAHTLYHLDGLGLGVRRRTTEGAQLGRGGWGPHTNKGCKTAREKEFELGLTVDNKYYITGMGKSHLTNDTVLVESIKRH